MTKYEAEFSEIAHTGGRYIIKVRTAADGQRQYSLGYSHSRPTAMCVHGVHALPQGVAVGMLPLAGIGSPMQGPPISGCYPIYIASDSHGMLGHSCPACKGYWRSGGRPTSWDTSCAYCGRRGEGHHFLTDGQRAYVRGCCDKIHEALTSERDGEYIVDMDAVASAAGKDGEKPPFYYTDEKQQNAFMCNACGAKCDILGKYGYCSCCGTHNGSQMLDLEINALRKDLGGGMEPSRVLREAVSSLDAYARSIAKQLTANVPMTAARKAKWEGALFHNTRRFADLKSDFDIDVLKGFKADDVEFVTRMYQRRHVYEHNGGQVDQQYIDESGDATVRLGQVIHETPESAARTCDLLLKMGRSLHGVFHELFPPEEKPIKMHEEEAVRRRGRT